MNDRPSQVYAFAIVIASLGSIGPVFSAGGPLVVEVDPRDPSCEVQRAAPRCSLDAALRRVNLAGSGVIRLAQSSVHTLREGVAINGYEGKSGLPSITGDVLLEGNDSIVERSTGPETPLFRLFHIAPRGRLKIRNLTIRNGATEVNTDGAGLWNTGTLELERVTVTGNSAGDDGGGIRNDGTLKLLNSVVSNNRASGEGGVGGGLYNLPVQGNGEAIVLGTVFRDNHAGDRGGAIWNSGVVTLEESTLIGNLARVQGGGLCAVGPVSLVRCHIVHNQAGARAGGISALEAVEAVETEISRNTAPAGPDYDGLVTLHERSN